MLVKVIVGIYIAGLAVMGLVAIMLLVTWPATKETLSQFKGGLWVDMALGVALIFATTILLYRMKRAAFYCAATGTVLSTVSTLVALASGIPTSAFLTPSSLFAYIFGLLVSFYTWSLWRQKALTLR